MRRRALAGALRQALRRWGVFLLIAALLFGMGSGDPLQAALSLPAMAAWPLDRALQAGVAPTAAWVAGSALAGLVPLLLTRRWWWPARWAEAERALPLAAACIARADRQAVAMLVLPWHAFGALGLALVRFGDGAHTLAAWGAWAVALGGSCAGGVAWLRWLRGRGAGARQRARLRGTAAAPWRIWWWLPLARGSARGTARLLLGLGLVNPALAAGPAVAPDHTGWWLAGLSLAALAGTSLLRGRIAVEWQGWREAARAWPLRPARLDAQACGLALLPVLAAVAVLGAVAAAGAGPALRPAVAAAYALALPLACWLEATGPLADAGTQAARWLLLAVTLVALGSEVAR